MMLILYDFKCQACELVHEALVPRDTESVSCPACWGSAARVISPVRCKLESHSGDFPSATMKWEKQHEKAGRQPSESDPNGW